MIWGGCGDVGMCVVMWGGCVVMWDGCGYVGRVCGNELTVIKQ